MTPTDPLAGIETPAVLIDLDLAEANIDRFQAHCDRQGLTLRPHIKTHKLPRLADRQIAAGAVGITCQKVSEAEAMVDAMATAKPDILLTYNVLGARKLAGLKALRARARLSVVADNAVTVAGLADAFADADVPLPVLVECETGAGRCGVQAPEDTLPIAHAIADAPGLTFDGLMTYPPAGREADVQAWLSRAKALLEADGLAVARISSGGSPGMWRTGEVPVATEYRIGTYVYNDRSLVSSGVCDWTDCALTVLATVVSVPTDGRAIIDAGSKVLTSDLRGLAGYGHVLDRPDIAIDQLSEEHGRLVADPIGLRVGDRVRIVPNHACVVSNMVDAVTTLRGGRVAGEVPVTARGKVR